MILCITFQNCWLIDMNCVDWLIWIEKQRLAALSDKVLFASSRASLVSASEIHANSWSLPNIFRSCRIHWSWFHMSTGVQCIFFVFPMWVWDLQGLEISAACTMASSNSRLSPTCIRHRGNFSTSWNAKTDTSRYTVSKVILMMLRLVMFFAMFLESIASWSSEGMCDTNYCETCGKYTRYIVT